MVWSAYYSSCMVLFRTQYTGDTHKCFLERLAWMGQNGEQTVSGAGRTSQGPDRKLQFLKKDPLH